MPTFIDESGDTGPVALGGKPYFRLAAVWVPTSADADIFREKVRALRREMGLRDKYEFKFAETHNHPDRRGRFFATALTLDFKFAIGAIDKAEVYWEHASSGEQHWACATELAASLRPIYCQAEQRCGTLIKDPVVVDDNKDKKFLAVIKAQFRGLESPIQSGASLIGKVSFRDSLADEMLQLVDMICGAFGDSDPTWYSQVRERHLP